jgi:hypothetical protein
MRIEQSSSRLAGSTAIVSIPWRCGPAYFGRCGRDAGRAVVGRRICPAHDTAEIGAEVRAALTELGHQRFIT